MQTHNWSMCFTLTSWYYLINLLYPKVMTLLINVLYRKVMSLFDFDIFVLKKLMFNSQNRTILSTNAHNNSTLLLPPPPPLKNPRAIPDAFWLLRAQGHSGSFWSWVVFRLVLKSSGIQVRFDVEWYSGLFWSRVVFR